MTTRKPSKATDDEIKEFLSKTKDSMGKAGMYYDAITKKYKKALKQDGKQKGSGRSLVPDKKYLNYVKEVEKRMGVDDANDIRTRQATATEKGFSKLQKERKLFGKALAGGVVAGVAGQAEAMKKAEEIKQPEPKPIRLRGKEKGDTTVEVGDAPEKGKIAQTTLKKRQEKREQMNEEIKKGQEKEQQKREQLEEEARTALAERAKNGDLRGAKVEQNAENEKEQKEKIVDVVVNHDATIDPLLDHADVEQETDHRKEIPIADAVPVPEKDEVKPSMRGRRKGEEFYNEDANEIPEASTDIPLPDDAPQNINMKITEQPKDEVEVEIEKSLPPSRGFISPMAEKVSMERNRMKYSGKRLYEECKSFVRIYDDDIKTKSFKKLVDKFESLTAKSQVGELRKLHRDLEEEVIEYYSGRQGLRLGVIIDPSVLGLNIGQLSSAMMPQIPIATSQTIREVGSQQTIQKTKDIHYHLGGRKHALDEQLPEGQNVENHIQETTHRKGRIKVPIAPPNRYLLKRDRRSYLPKNLKIKS